MHGDGHVVAAVDHQAIEAVAALEQRDLVLGLADGPDHRLPVKPKTKEKKEKKRKRKEKKERERERERDLGVHFEGLFYFYFFLSVLFLRTRDLIFVAVPRSWVSICDTSGTG